MEIRRVTETLRGGCGGLLGRARVRDSSAYGCVLPCTASLHGCSESRKLLKKGIDISRGGLGGLLGLVKLLHLYVMACLVQVSFLSLIVEERRVGEGGPPRRPVNNGAAPHGAATTTPATGPTAARGNTLHRGVKSAGQRA